MILNVKICIFSCCTHGNFAKPNNIFVIYLSLWGCYLTMCLYFFFLWKTYKWSVHCKVTWRLNEIFAVSIYIKLCMFKLFYFFHLCPKFRDLNKFMDLGGYGGTFTEIIGLCFSRLHIILLQPRWGLHDWGIFPFLPTRQLIDCNALKYVQLYFFSNYSICFETNLK